MASGAAAAGIFLLKIAAVAAISYALRPDQPDIEGPRLDSLAVQSSAYGAPIRKIWGSARTAGNVIWSEGITEHKHEEEIGKGSSGTQTTYTYTCSFAVGICEGEIAGIKRIWADSKLIYNAEDMSDPWAAYLKQQQSLDIVESMSVYTGTEDQEPDPVMESVEGDGNVPAYKGLAYIVFEDMQLTDFANRIPNLEFEIATVSTEQDVIKDFTPAYSFDYDEEHGLYILGQRCYIDIYNKDFDRIDQIEGFYGVGISHISGSLDTFLACKSGALREFNLFTHSAQLIMHCDYENYTSGGHWLNCAFTSGYFPEIFNGLLLVWTDKDNKICVIRSYGFTKNGSSYEPLKVFSVPGAYDSITIHNEQIIAHIHESRTIHVIDPYTEQLIDSFDSPEMDVISSHSSVGIEVLSNGDLMLLSEISNGKIYIMDGISGTQKTVTTFSDGAENPAQIDTIVSETLESVGLSASEYDVSELSGDTVIGYLRTDMYAAEEVIKPLMRLYQFDLIEADWQLQCVKRGGDVAVNIPWNDLSAHEYGNDQPEPLTETITAETELPLELILQYKDYDNDYQDNVEYATRAAAAVNTRQKSKLQYPVVMQATQALQAVETVFETTWAQRKKYQLQVPADYISLLPGSVITVADQYRLLIDELTISFPNLLKINASAEDPNSYISNSEAATPHYTSQQLSIVASQMQIFIDIPALQRYATNLGFFLASYHMTEGWHLAVVYRSLDDGQTWNQITSIESASTVGRTTDALADGPVTVVDYGNTVNVDLTSYDSALSGASLTSIFAGTNTAVIGQEGRWEIVSFSEVAEEADGTYTLSKLVRGRKGTDHNTDNHQTGDTFVLLKESALTWVPVPEDNLGNTVQYKILPAGKSLQKAMVQEFSCIGNVLKPYSPIHVAAATNAQGSLTISWLRRTRSSLGWNGPVPMLEQEESYEVDIINGGTVVRTLTTTEESATYGSSQIAEDFTESTAPETVTVKIYQMSDVVGRGFPAEIEAPLPEVAEYESGDNLIATPEILSPRDGQTRVDVADLTIQASEFDSDATDHVSSDWQISQSEYFLAGEGYVVWSSEDDTSNLTSISVPSDALDPDDTYYVRVRYNGESASSAWSAPSKFISGTADEAGESVPLSERDALLDFYEATGGAEAWKTTENMAKWSKDNPVSQWEGVTVSGGHVTGIDVSWFGLDGDAGSTLDPLDGTLQNLDVAGNWDLTGLDPTGLSSSLQKLDIRSTGLSSINLTGMSSLTEFDCQSSSVSSLDLSDVNLTRLSCNNTSISSLDLSGQSNLEHLTCYDTNLTSLDFSGCPSLSYLRCEHCDISTLNGDLTSLAVFRAEFNDISGVIDLAGCTDMYYFRVDANPVTGIINADEIADTGFRQFRAAGCDMDAEALDTVLCDLKDYVVSTYSSAPEMSPTITVLDNLEPPSITGQACGEYLREEYNIAVWFDT